MSMRTRVLGLVDIMMRVPPIIVIDEILKIGMGLPTRFYPTTTNSSTLYEASSVDAGGGQKENESFFSSILSTSSPNNNDHVANSTLEGMIDNASAKAAAGEVLSNSFGFLMNEISQDSDIADILTLTSVKFGICILGFFAAACIFMLWTRHLVMVYMFVVSFALTFLSYWSNSSVIAALEHSPSIFERFFSLNSTTYLDSGGLIMMVLPHLVAQWFMGMLFAYIHLGPRYNLLQRIMPHIFISPIVIALLPLPKSIVTHTPLVALTIPLLLTKISLLNSTMEAGKTFYNGYQYAVNFVSNFGLSALIENEWQRLNVPNVLRMFWTIRICQGFASILMNGNITEIGFAPIMQKLIVDGCETLTSVLGMTSIISVICNYIGRGFQWYLLSLDHDEEKSLGTVSAVLFYILALQTGLTSLAPEKRFVRLCRNLCLLVTALLHFLHNIVSPILMSLSAARNPSKKRHIRALSVCAFLIIAPMTFLMFLWARYTASTWLLAVTAFSVEVVIKVLVSLATYTLFLIDARRQSFWEKLDDYLYYVRAFGNSVEFCFGILLFFNGAWILVFESAENATGGAIRAIMMCIHAYFNIWCEAKAGWSVFMKRRSAVHKISTLPEATPAQLRDIDDVCAICYQEMFTAKITRCRHYFHGVCLRKWLYVQDRCPLCHEIMMYTDRNGDSEESTTNASPPAPPLVIYPRDDGNETEGGIRLSPRRSVSVGANVNAGRDISEVLSQLNSTEYGSNSSSTPAANNTTSSTAAAVATAAASNSSRGFRIGGTEAPQD